MALREVEPETLRFAEGDMWVARGDMRVAPGDMRGSSDISAAQGGEIDGTGTGASVYVLGAACLSC